MLLVLLNTINLLRTNTLFYYGEIKIGKSTKA